MNKLISIQQSKKLMDIFDEQDQFEDNVDDEMSEELQFFNDLSLSKNYNPESVDNKILAINEDKNLCKNEKCIEIRAEIKKVEEDCSYLEKKIELIDKAKTEEFFDISSKLSKVCKNIDELQPLMDAYQGISLSNLSYEQLAKIEFNLLKLLMKVRSKISKIEFSIMKGIIPKPEDLTTLCKICNEKDIDCLIHPCSHCVICMNCAAQSVKCPVCYKFIEYYDKIFLPNN